MPGGAPVPGIGAPPGLPGAGAGGTIPGQPPGLGGAPPGDPKMMAPGLLPPTGAGAPAADPRMMMKQGGLPPNLAPPPGVTGAPGIDPKTFNPGGANPGQLPQLTATPPGDPKGAFPNNPGLPAQNGVNPTIDPNAFNLGGAAPGIPGQGLNPGGAPGLPGGGGLGPAGYGAGGQNQAKPGSFEHVVTEFTNKMSAGDYTGMDELVASKARGTLAEIRDGELSEDQQAELKSAFEEASVDLKTRKNRGATIEVYAKGKQGHRILLAVGKDGDQLKLRDMDIREPSGSKKR
jgi:hypothetical protein